MTSTCRTAAAVLLALASGGALADSLELNLHDEALRATFAHVARPGMEWDVGHYYNEDDVTVTHLGLHVSGENWSKAGTFDVGLGGRLLLVRSDEEDASALALGARVRFSPVHRVGIGGELYFAPDITTFDEATRYTEATVRADYQLLPQALLYVGYRVIEMDFDDVDDVEIDDSFQVGMKLLW